MLGSLGRNRIEFYRTSVSNTVDGSVTSRELIFTTYADVTPYSTKSLTYAGVEVDKQLLSCTIRDSVNRNISLVNDVVFRGYRYKIIGAPEPVFGKKGYLKLTLQYVGIYET